MTSQTGMKIEGFFDPATWTVSYLLLDTRTMNCAIIDSVLDYDPKSGRTSTRSADRLVARVRELDASLQWILETHVHADHLSAAPHLKAQLGGRVAIGAQITAVQKVFGKLFNAGDDFATDGSQFDRLLADNESFKVGALDVRALHTPGHTPACMSYVVSDGEASVAFVGDTLFMPDYGTARCDFPGGDARTLYRSIQRLLSYPPNTAGALMTTEFVSVPADWTVARTLQHIREVERSRETVYAIYVLDPRTAQLLQVVTMRRLITGAPCLPSSSARFRA